jgi:hypothetical protein
MRRWLLFLMVTATISTFAAAGLLPVPAGAAGTAFCGQTWGSLPKQGGQGSGQLVGVRAGQQGCYDRLVFDIDGSGTGYHVQYVAQVLTQARGLPLSLRGGAFLNVTFTASTSAPNVVDVSGFRTFRQVAFGGSFEGYTTFGLGVRARLPFRVFTLAGPGSHLRLVVDVAHLW